MLFDLVNQPPLRIRYAQGSGKSLLISFASIGRKRGEIPPDEFVGTLLREPEWHAMFVSDLSRSWMNDPTVWTGVSDVVDRICTEQGITRITTLGISMGGFCALVASELFKVNTAIALSPQFSMSRDIFPNERRWNYWRKKLPNLKFQTAETNKRPNHSFLFHGANDDLSHAWAFPAVDGRDHFIFPEAGHSQIGYKFKSQNLLLPLVRAAEEQDRRKVANITKKCGGMWRDRYSKDQMNVLRERGARDLLGEHRVVRRRKSE